MLNSPKTRRILTYLMPILSLIVAASIVTHEYIRKSSLRQQIVQDERERLELMSKLPKPAKQALSAAPEHDHHDHAD